MSWSILKQAFKNNDMRKRMLFVLLSIVIFRFLAHIPVPLDEPGKIRDLLDNLFNSQQLLGFLDNLSGGALSNFSIVLMGLGPYINASIIFQLLSKAIPSLEEISKDGEAGRRKINQWTRLAALPLSIVQSIGILFLIRQQAGSVSGLSSFTEGTSMMQWVLMVMALTGGSMLLMWIGELVSEQGVGNGISLLIFGGIVSTLPSTIALLLSNATAADATYSIFGWFSLPVDKTGFLLALELFVMALVVTYLVVKLNEAQRIITVSYAKRVRGNRAYGGVNSVLPVKLITVGVIPIIFAAAFLSVPSFAGQIMSNLSNDSIAQIGTTMSDWFNPLGTRLYAFTNPATGEFSVIWRDFVYPISYFLLVVMFTYFYTGLMFSSKDIAENLQKQGGFIAGIRPGKQTEQYLSKIVNRLTLFGSIALALLTVMPFILDVIVRNQFGVLNISNQLTIGGIGLLIVVAVAIETLRQIESKALMVTYDQTVE